MSLPVKSSKRREYIAKIRKKGNFLFNANPDWNNGKLFEGLQKMKNFLAKILSRVQSVADFTPKTTLVTITVSARKAKA